MHTAPHGSLLPTDTGLALLAVLLLAALLCVCAPDPSCARPASPTCACLQYASQKIISPPQSNDPQQQQTQAILKFLPLMIGERV